MSTPSASSARCAPFVLNRAEILALMAQAMSAAAAMK